MKRFLKLSMLLLSSVVCVCSFGGWTTETDNSQRYVDSPAVATISSETIYFSSKAIDYYFPKYFYPEYRALNGMTNACGAVAGAEIVAYYDKSYGNLIPDWQSYDSDGKYCSQDDVYVPELMWDLYNRMNTNVNGPGVSEQEFLDGLKSYVHDHGYTISYRSLVNGSDFDFNTYKNAVKTYRTAVLFSNPGDVYFVGETDTYDVVTGINIPSAHIMTGCGYYVYRYYGPAGDLKRADFYLLVEVGLPTLSMALCKVDPHNLSAGYIVYVN